MFMFLICDFLGAGRNGEAGASTARSWPLLISLAQAIAIENLEAIYRRLGITTCFARCGQFERAGVNQSAGSLMPAVEAFANARSVAMNPGST